MKVLIILSLLAASANAWTSNCGTAGYAIDETDSLIVGGRQARAGQFPWQVSLDDGRGSFCGGTIINRNWVLTAAHCCDTSSPRDFDVVAGAHNLNRPTSNQRKYSLNRIVVHPNWNDRNNDFDIALLRTSSAMSLNRFRHPACKPRTNSYSGSTSIVSGWGAIRSGGPSSSTLLYISVPILSNSQCNTHAEFRPNQIKASMLCAGRMSNNQQDSCQGDSGGPLVVARRNKYEIVGVVSWGYGCAGQSPGVYARVSSALSWIDRTI